MAEFYDLLQHVLLGVGVFALGAMFGLTVIVKDVKATPYQTRVGDWLLACFGKTIADNKQERNERFLEESLELVQACDLSVEDAHALVDYVYGRPVGEKAQEVGGVMVTLAALCRAQQVDMDKAAETELDRVWTKIEKVREKQKAKPSLSPLPGAYPERQERQS